MSEVDDREPELGKLTDVEWLAGHRWLLDQVDPSDPLSAELGYVYDPDLRAGTVEPGDLSTGRDPAEPHDLPTPFRLGYGSP